MIIGKIKITIHFLWFDMWFGLFIDSKKKTWYIAPFPMVIFKIAPAKPIRDVGDRYRKGVEHMAHALKTGGWGHAVWCNFPHHETPTQTFCNCGITDLIRAYEEDTGKKWKDI